MVREVSYLQLNKGSDKIESLMESLKQAVNGLSEHNQEAAQIIAEAMAKAVERINIENHIDMSAIAEAMHDKKNDTSWTFVMERNTANMITKVRAIPDES